MSEDWKRYDTREDLDGLLEEQLAQMMARYDAEVAAEADPHWREVKATTRPQAIAKFREVLAARLDQLWSRHLARCDGLQ